MKYISSTGNGFNAETDASEKGENDETTEPLLMDPEVVVPNGLLMPMSFQTGIPRLVSQCASLRSEIELTPQLRGLSHETVTDTLEDPLVLCKSQYSHLLT